MLDISSCRVRQRRVLDLIQRHALDAIVVGESRHVYYLSGFQPFYFHHAAVVIWADGRSWMVSGTPPTVPSAIDEIAAYQATWMATQRNDQRSLVAEAVLAELTRRHAKRIGIDASSVTGCVEIQYGREGRCAISIEEDLLQLRRPKDADEMELIRKAIGCTRVMYERAREIIEPGIEEVTVFGELQASAVRFAGEPLNPMHLGNDYACGVPGGPARPGRRAKAGELYILDLGPAYRGYFADNARAISVDRKPTDAQFAAHLALVQSLKIVEQMARPGVRCRDIFAAVDEHLRKSGTAGLPHHLGHGIGLQAHEFPHLNPKWDDVLIAGEVFTAEPGIYGAPLAGGIRLENDYLLTRNGVENLSPFPLGLI